MRGGQKLYIGASSIGEMICDTKPLDSKRFKSSKDVLTGLNELDGQCLEWLETGRVGASSRALCFHLGGDIVKEKINEAFGEYVENTTWLCNLAGGKSFIDDYNFDYIPTVTTDPELINNLCCCRCYYYCLLLL